MLAVVAAKKSEKRTKYNSIQCLTLAETWKTNVKMNTSLNYSFRFDKIYK